MIFTSSINIRAPKISGESFTILKSLDSNINLSR